MKLRVRRESFLKGCRLAGRALAGRVVEPAVGRVLLEAREGACTLQIVGTEVGLRLQLPAVVEEAGEALLPVRHALAVMREAAADELTLESGPGRVRAQGEEAEFLLETPGPGRPATAGTAPAGACHLLPPDLLCQAVRRTLFAAGGQTSRYNLQGVLWEVEFDQVRLVATDNRRLAVAELPAQAADDSPIPPARLLPSRAMDLLARLADGEGEPVRVVFGERRAWFGVGPSTLVARYVEGAFPDWRRAAPPRPRHLLPLPVGPFLAGVRQAAALREKEGARILLRFEPGWALLESRRAGAGRSRVRLPLPLAGARAEVALDPRLLTELLRAFDPDSTLLLGLAGPDTPALFTDGDSYSHVLMPLR